MPIIGHALAGIVLAQHFDPAARRRPSGPVTHALWLPLLVVLSYLPDVAAHAGQWMGVGSTTAQAVGHSIPIGLLVGALVGRVWAGLAAGPARLFMALAAGAIVLHDLFDLLQDAERMPFWPLSHRQLGVDWLAYPDRLWNEFLVFGVPFALYETWRVIRRRGQTAPSGPGSSRTLIWAGRVIVLATLLAALTVLQLREVRERQMDEAISLVRAGRFTEALVVVDLAERWPSSPGAGDITRGEAWDGLGDAVRAESAFLRAYERNPDDFWPVAVLAQHYASYGTRAERLQRSAPWVERLLRQFPGHDALGRVLDGIDRILSKAP